jgi:hypothetical protein
LILSNDCALASPWLLIISMWPAILALKLREFRFYSLADRRWVEQWMSNGLGLDEQWSAAGEAEGEPGSKSVSKSPFGLELPSLPIHSQ